MNARTTKPRRSKAEREIELMAESGYRFPKPIRRSFYVYPVQMEMMKEISREWKMSLREVFLEAVQFYIHSFLDWRDGEEGGGGKR